MHLLYVMTKFSGVQWCINYCFCAHCCQWWFLKPNIPLSYWYADNFRFVWNVLNMFNVSTDCYSKESERITGKSLLVDHINEKKWCLKFVLVSLMYWTRNYLVPPVGIDVSGLLSFILWDYFLPYYPWCWVCLWILFLINNW